MFEGRYKGVFSKMGEGLLEKLAQDLEKELQERETPELLLRLGIAYVRLGKSSKAREVYRRLKELDSEKAKELLDYMYEL
jgi:tetratricopeptide (TPR) repeat protein